MNLATSPQGNIIMCTYTKNLQSKCYLDTNLEVNNLISDKYKKSINFVSSVLFKLLHFHITSFIANKQNDMNNDDMLQTI